MGEICARHARHGLIGVPEGTGIGVTAGGAIAVAAGELALVAERRAPAVAELLARDPEPPAPRAPGVPVGVAPLPDCPPPCCAGNTRIERAVWWPLVSGWPEPT